MKHKITENLKAESKTKYKINNKNGKRIIKTILNK